MKKVNTDNGSTLGIGEFVYSAILLRDKYNRQNAGLSLICSALDASAKNAFPKITKNNEKIKKFIQVYFPIISVFGFPGISAGGIRIKCSNIPDIKTDSRGFVGIEDIIYYTIRCCLIHGCEVDSRIKFTNETLIGDFDKSGFSIPKDIFWGLTMAVVLCENNANQREVILNSIKIGGKTYQLSELWGKEREFLK